MRTLDEGYDLGWIGSFGSIQKYSKCVYSVRDVFTCILRVQPLYACVCTK